MSQWFALYTKPRAEKVAEAALKEKGIEAYLPMQKKLKQWSDRKKWIEEPVLRSYIFVRGKPSIVERARFTRGVVKPICLGDRVEAIPDEQMERLKRVIQSGETFEVDSPDKYSPGDKVEVLEGNLAGLSGEMVENRGKKKLLIRIDGVQHVFLLNISPNNLKKLPK